MTTSDLCNLAARSGYGPQKDAVMRQLAPKGVLSAQDKPRQVRGMNGTERAFAAHLAALRASGSVVWFGYQPVKLLLAERTTYTPDFLVITSDGAWEAVDCKGTKRMADGRETYYAREDSIVKIKLAAELLPFRFCVVFKTSDGWQRKEYRGLADRIQNTVNPDVSE